MIALKNFQINKTPFFFLKKKRVIFLKKLYAKKRKYFYYLVSRRKFLKLLSKRYKLEYTSITETYKNNHKFFKYLYHFTMNTGLKTKNEIKDKYSYFNITDLERLNIINYSIAKIYNNNFKNIWFFFNYLNSNNSSNKIIKNINILLDYKKINPNINSLVLNGDLANKILIGIMPDYFNWYYIYNIYIPNIKFKYLHSYNYLTKVKLKKFSWFYYNKKRLKIKYNILALKLKNKNKILFFYEYLFYSNLFNTNNNISLNFLNTFNFFYNTFEYSILTNYLNVDIKVSLYSKTFPYYFKKNNNNLLKKNIYTFFFNNKNNNCKNIFLQSLFLFSFLNVKYKKINKINKINNINNKTNLNWNIIYIYYYILLIDFIFLLLKYINLNNKNKNNKIFYYSYYLKLSWIIKKIKK